MLNPISFMYLVVAVIDYLFKAAVMFRETEQGRAEWLDVEARYADAFGNDQEASEARANAADVRRGAAVKPGRINLND